MNQPDTTQPAPTEASAPAKSAGEGMLEQLRQEHEGTLKRAAPQQFDDYMKIVVAGMKILYSPQTHELELKGLAKIQGPETVLPIVVKGVTNIIGLLFQESRGKLALPMAIPAAITLASYVLGDVEKMKKIPMTGELIGSVLQALTKQLFTVLKFTPQKVQGVIQKGAEMQPKGALNAPAQASPPPQQAGGV